MSNKYSIICDFCGFEIIENDTVIRLSDLGAISFTARILTDKERDFHYWKRKRVHICPDCLKYLKENRLKKERERINNDSK